MMRKKFKDVQNYLKPVITFSQLQVSSKILFPVGQNNYQLQKKMKNEYFYVIGHF